MIYLIGGVSKAGKSFISRKIMEEKKIPYFSTDFLLWSLGGDDGLFSYFDTDEEVSPKLEKYIMKIVYFLNKNNEDYVIEGTHITIELYKKLKELYSDNVKGLFLGYGNADPIAKHSEILEYEDEKANKWYTVISEKEFIEFIDKQIKKSKSIKKECEINNIPYYDIENIKEESDNILSDLIGM